jgi:hypothetical protein
MEAADDADHYSHPAAPEKKHAHHADTGAHEVWDAAIAELKRRREPDDQIIDPILGKMNGVAVVGRKGDSFEVAAKFSGIFSVEQISLIEDALSTVTGGLVKLVMHSSDKAKDKKTVGEVKKEKETSRKDLIKEEVMQDPLIRSAVDLFGGEIVDIDTQEPGLF